VKLKMAYNRRKIVAYGGVGAAIALVTILAFISAPFTEVELAPIVELESVMTGTLAVTVIADSADIEVTEIKLTIDRLEVKPVNENWREIDLPGGRVSFDLLQRQGTFIDTVINQLEPETMLRMHIVQQMGKIDQPINKYANATLNSGDVVDLLLTSEYLEVKTPIALEKRVYIIRS